MTLAQRLLELHRALARRRVSHAFGGAIALAYWTRNPRGTSDIDVNVFVPAADSRPALAALPAGIAQREDTAETIARDGQVRLWWDGTPVDLFFDYEPVHELAARNRQIVPFEGVRIPVLGPTELAVFKAVFNRTRHWADIEEMLAAGNLDLDAVRAQLDTMLEEGDPRFGRLEQAARLAAR